jgi:hypothetical protein
MQSFASGQQPSTRQWSLSSQHCEGPPSVSQTMGVERGQQMLFGIAVAHSSNWAQHFPAQQSFPLHSAGDVQVPFLPLPLLLPPFLASTSRGSAANTPSAAAPMSLRKSLREVPRAMARANWSMKSPITTLPRPDDC